MLLYYSREKTRTCLPEMVPKLGNKTVSRAYTGAEVKKPNGGKKHERNFNEAAFRGRCSFWTSDKKMEP